MRQAVVWLSQTVGAAILKLQDSHYNENSLQVGGVGLGRGDSGYLFWWWVGAARVRLRAAILKLRGSHYNDNMLRVG